MEKKGLNQIREEYLKFFESKGHLRLNSFSLVPKYIFKPIFYFLNYTEKSMLTVCPSDSFPS